MVSRFGGGVTDWVMRLEEGQARVERWNSEKHYVSPGISAVSKRRDSHANQMLSSTTKMRARKPSPSLLFVSRLRLQPQRPTDRFPNYHWNRFFAQRWAASASGQCRCRKPVLRQYWHEAPLVPVPVQAPSLLGLPTQAQVPVTFATYWSTIIWAEFICLMDCRCLPLIPFSIA